MSDEEQPESGDEEQPESGDEEQDEFEIPPDPRVLKALTENPLQWIQALCELIDNSIDSFWAARAAGRAVDDPRIEVFIPGAAEVSRGEGRFMVRDNGPGLDKEGLRNALRAGYAEKGRFDRLGLFGMGFNIATGKIGQRTVVTTARAQDGFASRAVLDLPELIARESFVVPYEEVPKPDGLEQGTIVEVSNWWPKGHSNEKFALKIAQQSQAAVVGNIGRRYSTVLRGMTNLGRVSIAADGEQVVGYQHCVWDQSRFVERGSNRVHARKDFDHVLASHRRCGHDGTVVTEEARECPSCHRTKFHTVEERVRGWVGIQRFDHTNRFGIDLIRNGRAILVSEKEAFFSYPDELGSPSREYPVDDQTGRIVGEVHLDHVQVDFLKKDFERASAEWERAMEYLRGESLRPKKWADGSVNDSPVSVLHGAYKRIRRFGRGDMYMGRWDAAKGKAVRIGRDVEDDLYQKFLAGDPGYLDDAEWWKYVEFADVPPPPPQQECPTCDTKSGLDVEECPGCAGILRGKECVSGDCGQEILRSAVTCPHCGAAQVDEGDDPWCCEYCSKSNPPSELSCGQCLLARGASLPTSLEFLVENSLSDQDLGREGVRVRLADGTQSDPLSVEVFQSSVQLRPSYDGERVPLITFKEDELKVFLDASHPIFTELGVRPVELVAVEVAQFVYARNGHLVGSKEHVASNLVSQLLLGHWADELSVTAQRVDAQLEALFEDVVDRLDGCPEASDFFRDLPVDRQQEVAHSIFEAGLQDELDQLTHSSGYLSWLSKDLFADFFDKYPDRWLELVFAIDLPDPAQVGERVATRVKEMRLGEVSRCLGDCAAVSLLGDSPPAQLLERASLAVEFLGDRLR